MTPDAKLRMDVFREGQIAYGTRDACPYTDWRAKTWQKGHDSAKAYFSDMHAAFDTQPPAAEMVSVPLIPTELQWGGLARDIMMAFDMDAKSPAPLIKTLKNRGHEIPQWFLDEVKDPESTHVLSKGTRVVLIYRAMVDAAQLEGATS